jgi:predicted nucleic acid-binding protein
MEKTAQEPLEGLGDEGLIDAGPFIGALSVTDPRHAEALPLVEAARAGRLRACTTTGILSEVYAVLTWHLARTPHSPQQAAQAVAALVAPPSLIRILPDSLAVALKSLELAAKYNLTARRVHDARHAAAALAAGVSRVYTYDVDDWKAFGADGLAIGGPPSALARLSGPPALARLSGPPAPTP